jgi:hypothetical protein
MVGSPRLMGADFRSLRKQEVNMAHPTPFEAIAAAIESATHKLLLKQLVGVFQQKISQAAV